MKNKNQRRVSVVISSQTLYHLENMRQFCGYKDIGRVIDKLVRDKQISLNGGMFNNATGEYQYRKTNR